MVHAPNAISCSRAWASPHFKGATWPSTRCFEMFAEGSSNHEAPTSCVIQRYLWIIYVIYHLCVIYVSLCVYVSHLQVQTIWGILWSIPRQQRELLWRLAECRMLHGGPDSQAWLLVRSDAPHKCRLWYWTRLWFSNQLIEIGTSFKHWVPPGISARNIIFHRPASVSQASQPLKMLRNMPTAPQPAPNSKTRQFKQDFSTWARQRGKVKLMALQLSILICVDNLTSLHLIPDIGLQVVYLLVCEVLELDKRKESSHVVRWSHMLSPFSNQHSFNIWGFPKMGVPLNHPFQWDFPL